MKSFLLALLVAASALAVSPAFAECSPSALDAGIATAIDARFQADDLIAFVDVDVRVKDGVATIYGTVRSPEAKAAVLGEARAIAGVAGVVSHIRVRPSLL